MTPICSTRTSVSNYHLISCNVPEERHTQLYRDGGLYFQTTFRSFVFVTRQTTWWCKETREFHTTSAEAFIKAFSKSALKFILHTPWSRVLLEKLNGFQPAKKFPAFYGTRRFIIAFTSARHLSVSWASSTQSILSHPTSRRSILILSSHLWLGLPSGLFLSGFPTKPCIRLSSPPYVLHAPPISFFSVLSPPLILGEEYRSLTL